MKDRPVILERQDEARILGFAVEVGKQTEDIIIRTISVAPDKEQAAVMARHVAERNRKRLAPVPALEDAVRRGVDLVLARLGVEQFLEEPGFDDLRFFDEKEIMTNLPR